MKCSSSRQRATASSAADQIRYDSQYERIHQTWTNRTQMKSGSQWMFQCIFCSLYIPSISLPKPIIDQSLHEITLCITWSKTVFPDEIPAIVYMLQMVSVLISHVTQTLQQYKKTSCPRFNNRRITKSFKLRTVQFRSTCACPSEINIQFSCCNLYDLRLHVVLLRWAGIQWG